MVRQTAAQLALQYQRVASYGVTATRVYDAVGGGATVLAAANTANLMGAPGAPQAPRCAALHAPSPNP